ncbi:hypothetical protein [Colwellia psychrerythraea]|uniref:Lipoprotein n=1 Tax=Colwellia psychrerythraea TaxID=28229 RepID=A0A099KRI8_COLPS|nr:hypothetical protein [Colwellia psychrerythraea]KGJ92268.1 hypothetical protein GAB14E_2856 [Colwellia psychrerythraea]
MKRLTAKLAHNYILPPLCALFLGACAGPSTAVLGQAQSEWDFDHQLQFKKTIFDADHYQLEVIANNKVSFERLSAFLLRRSYLICGQYGYKLELIKGVESFDFPRASPNLIMPNLTAKLECAIHK